MRASVRERAEKQAAENRKKARERKQVQVDRKQEALDRQEAGAATYAAKFFDLPITVADLERVERRRWKDAWVLRGVEDFDLEVRLNNFYGIKWEREGGPWRCIDDLSDLVTPERR